MSGREMQERLLDSSQRAVALAHACAAVNHLLEWSERNGGGLQLVVALLSEKPVPVDVEGRVWIERRHSFRLGIQHYGMDVPLPDVEYSAPRPREPFPFTTAESREMMEALAVAIHREPTDHNRTPLLRLRRWLQEATEAIELFPDPKEGE